MYKILQENIKWFIAGLSVIWCISSMVSCVIETNISEDRAETEITKTFTEKGYIQKQMNGYYYKVWTKPGENVVIKTDD